MARYLISFDDGAMDVPAEELAGVARDVSVVRREAKRAGVWIFGAGLGHHEVVSVVETDGTVTDVPRPESGAHIGGFAIFDVPSRDAALEWAARLASACRCAQEVFELLPQTRDELDEA